MKGSGCHYEYTHMHTQWVVSTIIIVHHRWSTGATSDRTLVRYLRIYLSSCVCARRFSIYVGYVGVGCVWTSAVENWLTRTIFIARICLTPKCDKKFKKQTFTIRCIFYLVPTEKKWNFSVLKTRQEKNRNFSVNYGTKLKINWCPKYAALLMSYKCLHLCSNVYTKIISFISYQTKIITFTEINSSFSVEIWYQINYRKQWLRMVYNKS